LPCLQEKGAQKERGGRLVPARGREDQKKGKEKGNRSRGLGGESWAIKGSRKKQPPNKKGEGKKTGEGGRPSYRVGGPRPQDFQGGKKGREKEGKECYQLINPTKTQTNPPNKQQRPPPPQKKKNPKKKTPPPPPKKPHHHPHTPPPKTQKRLLIFRRGKKGSDEGKESRRQQFRNIQFSQLKKEGLGIDERRGGREKRYV